MTDIESLVRRFSRYWRRSGVPRDQIREMSTELSQHLRDAVEDGKPLSHVVGDDPTGFAELWASEYRRGPLLPASLRPSLIGSAASALGALSAGVTAISLATKRIPVIETVLIQAEGGSGANTQATPSGSVTIWDLPKGEVWFWTAVAATVLGIIGSVLLARGRVVPGLVVLVLGAPVVFLSPEAGLATGFYVLAAGWVIWSLGHARPRGVHDLR